MKKTILLFCFAMVVASGHAQLQVYSNGNTSFGPFSSNMALSPISIGFDGRADSKISVQGQEIGIYSYRDGSAHWGNAIYAKSDFTNTDFVVGVRTEAVNSTPLASKRSFGIFGVAGNATSGWNYGVFGRLQGTNNGAGVYGTVTNDENGVDTQGRYAGYFNGATKVVGDLTVTGSIHGVLLGQSASINSSSAAKSTSYATDYETDNSFSNKISNLNLVSYYMPQESASGAKDQNASGDTLVQKRQPSKIELQSLEKKHYALSADQLKENFPDLVYKQEDGTSAINYMEMIPVLVQTINELNSRINQLESSAAFADNQTTKINTVDGSIATTLYQNVPNPVKSQSTISLDIAKDVKDATLYFYNISGAQVKSYNVAERGKTSISLSSSDFEPGLYVYALVADGNVVSTKRMIVEK
jgi:hypothetical protein